MTENRIRVIRDEDREHMDGIKKNVIFDKIIWKNAEVVNNYG